MHSYDSLLAPGRAARYVDLAGAEVTFVVEMAQLNFDGYGARELDLAGVVPLWRDMQMTTVSKAVDGGAASDPVADAQIIALYVEAPPIGLGIARMATR